MPNFPLTIIRNMEGVEKVFDFCAKWTKRFGENDDIIAFDSFLGNFSRSGGGGVAKIALYQTLQPALRVGLHSIIAPAEELT